MSLSIEEKPLAFEEFLFGFAEGKGTASAPTSASLSEPTDTPYGCL